MKTIFVIRHAKSSWKDPSLRDIDRPLNNRGLRDAPFMAKLLAGKGIKVDRLISSPANRAFTTATYFAKAFGITPDDIQKDESIYHAYPEDLSDLVRGLPEDLNTVFLFGHNPTFTSFVNRFTSNYIANVPTCGIAQVEADVSNWADFNTRTAKLVAYHYPKQYFS